MSDKKETAPNDLRSAIELLKNRDGEFVTTDIEVDPHAEISGVIAMLARGGHLRASDP